MTTSPLTQDESEAAWYLAGLFDGEGHIEPNRAGSGRFVISNTDASIITAACNALAVLGIEYRMRVRDRREQRANPQLKPVTEIMINRKAARQRFAEVIPLRSTAKRARVLADTAASQLTIAA